MNPKPTPKVVSILCFVVIENSSWIRFQVVFAQPSTDFLPTNIQFFRRVLATQFLTHAFYYQLKVIRDYYNYENREKVT